MTPPNLEVFFRPASIAVIGASVRPLMPGGRALRLLQRSFPGTLYAVNPRHEEIGGTPCYRSVADLPEVPDLAVIAVPAPDVPSAVHDCVERGVRGAIVFSSGFAETGADGAALQEKIRRIAQGSSLRVCGPNALGAICVESGTYATFTSVAERDLGSGHVAILSQSGGFGAMLLSAFHGLGIGVSHFFGTGNEVDVNLAEVLVHLVREPRVRVIVVFAESLSEPDLLVVAAQEAKARGISIVILKVGSSEVGSRAAISHSAALVGDDDVNDAALRELGILRVDSLDEMIDVTRVTLASPRLVGSRLACITASGGLGALIADLATQAGLVVPTLAQQTREHLDEVLPAFGSSLNPVDITAMAASDPSSLTRIMSIVVESNDVDAVLLALGPMDPVAEQLVEAAAKVWETCPIPLVVVWGGGSRKYKQQLQLRGVPTFEDPRRAVTALADYQRLSAVAVPVHSPLVNVPPRGAGQPPSADAAPHTLYEDEAYALLAEQGIRVSPYRVASSAEDLLAVASALRFPVAVKVRSRQITHKSDVGGVRLHVSSPGELESAFRSVVSDARRAAPEATIDGVLVQEMANGSVELMCGVKTNPVWGAVVTVGLGGRLVEVLAASQCGFLPRDDEDARRLLARLVDGRLLTGPRSLSGEALASLCDLLVRMRAVAVSHPEITAVDLNPLVISDDCAVAVDALMTFEQDFAPVPRDARSTLEARPEVKETHIV